MKYVRMEPIITTVANREVEDDAEIKSILDMVMTNQYYVEIGYIDHDSGNSVNYTRARITGVGQDTLDIHAFLPTASLKLKAIPINSLQKIKLIASKQEIVQKYKVSRWMLMDVAEISE